jgi:hypothetical protein
MQPKLNNYKASGPEGHKPIFSIIGLVNFHLGWCIQRAMVVHIVFLALFAAKI